jgi:rod shape-determining protein MreD
MNVAVSYTSREEIEVHRFSWIVSLSVPVLALLIQSLFPLRLKFLEAFDLPLLVTIFFAVSRRRPIPGLLTGAIIGTLQDAIAGSGHPIGLYGISKTLIGYFAASLGVKIDVDNPGSRFLMTFGFYVLHQVIYAAIVIALVGASEPWRWPRVLVQALLNGLLAVVLFALLDRFKERA